MNAPLLRITPELSTRVAEKTVALHERLHAICQRYASVAFANSLGAEDMVLTDCLQKLGLPVDIFSLDTGRLPAETYDLMATVDRHYGLKLKVYFPHPEDVEAYVRTQGINAFYDSVAQRKACCQVRKVLPLQRALAGKEAWITGLRAEQSATRTDLPFQEFDTGNNLEKFNPLADWTEKEVWTYLLENKVPTNALHGKFYPSIGCAPCTRAISPGEDIRAGRWWWENPDSKECGLHPGKPS